MKGSAFVENISGIDVLVCHRVDPRDSNGQRKSIMYDDTTLHVYFFVLFCVDRRSSAASVHLRHFRLQKVTYHLNLSIIAVFF